MNINILFDIKPYSLKQIEKEEFSDLSIDPRKNREKLIIFKKE